MSQLTLTSELVDSLLRDVAHQLATPEGFATDQEEGAHAALTAALRPAGIETLNDAIGFGLLVRTVTTLIEAMIRMGVRDEDALRVAAAAAPRHRLPRDMR